MTTFIEINGDLVNTKNIHLIRRSTLGCLVFVDGGPLRRETLETHVSMADLVMALEFVGCRTWLTSYGDGKKEPRPGEMAERQWRAGEDGLRPSESAREELQ